MLGLEAIELYNRLRLKHYQSLFGRIRERDGSLSATEAYSVDVIYLLNGPTIKQFSEFLGISQPNATYKVNNLVSKGYVVKTPSSDDKREFRLGVSEKFHSYYGDRDNFIAMALEKLEKEYSPEELALLDRMFRDLVAALGRAESGEAGL